MTSLIRSVAATIFVVDMLFGASPLYAQPAEVIIVRHAEKQPDAVKSDALLYSTLTPRGYERAAALATFFLENFGLPDYVFAVVPDSGYQAVRTIQTCIPIAAYDNQSKVTDKHNTARGFELTYAIGETQQLGKDLLHDPKYAGKRIVICWEHNHINKLAQALGVTEPLAAWPDNAFDVAYVLTFQDKKLASFKKMPQKLLYGDAETVTW